MKRFVSLALIASAASPAVAAGASGFILVNGTGATLAGLSIRRVGTQEWKPLGSAPAAGMRSSIAFKDPDCAFDIKATLAGNRSVTWADVNLCAVKSVTLNHDDAAGAWVDYDH